MKKRFSVTINTFIVEKVDEIARGLKASRSRAIEDLLSMIFDLGATVESGKLLYHSEKEEDLEERVEWLKQVVQALTAKKEA